ncbi:MAG: hydantoinase/oxoprolinase family protein [Cloacibacillus sp.]
MVSQAMRKKGILGIDAGGTFTDLVFFEDTEAGVVAKVKTPTLHDDLIMTIENGLRLILQQIHPEQVQAVNLATTLATNAIVEGKLRSSALILIGYADDIVEKYKTEKKFGTDFVYQVKGGHDAKGNENAAFDEEAFVKICKDELHNVSTVAISAYFSVRNPSHELRARELVCDLRPDIVVTCGHELATDLDALKRATTVALNAGLIPIIIDLLNSVAKVCGKYGVVAPIMVVRGDGSLVSMDWARVHPIETVLSGPAASALGACYLSRAAERKNRSCVVDIGGTTTDIIYLNKDGRPALSTDGITVGGHRTLVKSIDILTFGLGGDSRVRFSKKQELLIGPGRVRSLCSAASEYPVISEYLEELSTRSIQQEPLIVFKGSEALAVTFFEKNILSMLQDGPLPVNKLLENERLFNMAMVQLDEMEQRGLIQFAGFTPTDALAVLGKISKWDRRASEFGARILMAETRDTTEDICREICEKVSRLAAKNVFMKSLSKELFHYAKGGDGERLIDYALSPALNGASAIQLKLNADLIGVGAPSWAFIEKSAELLARRSILPTDAEVAGAVGAAVGTFYLRYAVLIAPLQAGGYRAHLPMEIRDFEVLEEAVLCVINDVCPWLTERAKNAGAKIPLISYQREDEDVRIAGGARKVHLCTHIYFTVTEQ